MNTPRVYTQPVGLELAKLGNSLYPKTLMYLTFHLKTKSSGLMLSEVDYKGEEQLFSAVPTSTLRCEILRLCFIL